MDVIDAVRRSCVVGVVRITAARPARVKMDTGESQGIAQTVLGPMTSSDGLPEQEGWLTRLFFFQNSWCLSSLFLFRK